MRKAVLAIIGILFAAHNVFAQQNLLVNGNFEDMVSCPSYGQPQACNGWASYNAGSPDYFHPCATGPNVPVNGFGWQFPASGQAYMGIVEYNGTGNTFREYLTSYMTPMQIGGVYEVSLSVNLANTSSKWATNGMCVHFFDTGIIKYTASSGIINLTPKINFTSYGVISDTQNWVRLSALFTADSAYDHIAIGGFLDHPQLTAVQVQSTGSYAYVYIDSVVVKLADSLFYDLTKTDFCSGDTLHVNYSSYKKKQPNNIFSIQLSDASGSFATPVTIGTKASDTSGTIIITIPPGTPTGAGYKIRLLASNYADTAGAIVNVRIGQGPVAKPVAGNNGPVCAGNTLQLTASTTTPGVTWSWTGPSSFTSPVQNPFIASAAVANNGQYIVTASLYGCKAADTTNVTIANSAILGSISATSNTPICAGDTLKLTGNSTASGVTYSWTGPNGFSATTQNTTIPNASAAATGTYIFKVSNGVCQLQASTNVVVNPSAGSVTATANTPCEGSPLQFNATASSSTGVIFGWAGPNSYTSSLQNPVIGSAAPIHAGRYIVSATINLCIVKDTVDVIVKPTPAKPDANNNGPLCEGAQLNLTSTTTTSGVTYAWTGPSSYTSATQNNTINNSTTAMSGDYIITVNLNGCEAKDTTTVLVKPLPAATTLSSNGPLCVGSSLQVFSTASSTGASYLWNGPNSFAANTQNASLPNAQTNATGWYRQTLSLNGCSRKDSIQVVVNPIPAAPAPSYTGPLCAGEQMKLNASTVPGATYSWTGPNGYTANTQNPVRNNINTGFAGVYGVTATVNGCTSSQGSMTVSINPAPFVVIFGSPGDTICDNTQATFVALPNNVGGTPTYRWYVNSQFAGAGINYATTTLNDQDVIRCEMTENTKCSSTYTDASNDIAMTVLPWLAPSVTITANPNGTVKENEYITFTATPTNGGNKPTYQWKRNGQNVQGATSDTWSANSLSDNDVISVELISNYRCPQPATATSNDIKVKVIPTGVNDVNTLKGINLYPNPNNGTFTLKGEVEVSGVLSAEVINAVGQVVHRENIEVRNKEINTTIQVNGISEGVYLLRMRSQQGQLVQYRFTVTQ